MSGQTAPARTPLFRAYLSCNTCNNTVAVGPAVPDPTMAAYYLGREAKEATRRHFDQCEGAELTITSEEVAS